MTILENIGTGGPLWRAQLWASEHLTSPDYAFDPRLAVAGLLSHALNAAWKNTATRASQGARFAHRVTAADTMVAAGGR
jgi:hypothetical protein